MEAHGTDHHAAAAADFSPDSGVIAEMVGRPLRFDSTRYLPTDSYAQVATDRVWRAHQSLGLTGESRESILALLAELTEPWGRLPVGTPPSGPAGSPSTACPSRPRSPG